MKPITDPVIDIRHVPFSAFCSHLTFSVLPPEWKHEGLVVRSMFGGVREAFHLRVLRGDEVLPYTVESTATLCRLVTSAGDVRVCFEGRDLARFSSDALTLRLMSVERGRFGTGLPIGPDGYEVILSATRSVYHFRCLRGKLRPDVPVVPHVQAMGDRQGPARNRPSVVLDLEPDATGTLDVSLELFRSTPLRPRLASDFAGALRKARKDWSAFARRTPKVPRKYAAAATVAMQVNYAAMVAPGGFLHRPTMLMSKNWMTSCWSWDHCFNALAYARTDPDLAWNQLNVHFDLQDRFGCLPDGVNTTTCGWNYVKPPIHGWTLGHLMTRHPQHAKAARLKAFYPRLARWTRWWLDHRDSDGDGLPEYHHGNDSGWDNATVFDSGFPVAGCDLAAFLVVQMDTLAEVARRLGKGREARAWTSMADGLTERLLERLWTGEGFVSLHVPTRAAHPEGDCSINLMPLLLGKRLPAGHRRKLAEALRPGGRFVTDYGPATENPASPHYGPDSYWRGPIWPSQTVLLVDGLARSGFAAQARDLARRYCDMCLKSMTFAENYNAMTGEPLRDKAYTWGSSGFLFLASEYA